MHTHKNRQAFFHLRAKKKLCRRLFGKERNDSIILHSNLLCHQIRNSGKTNSREKSEDPLWTPPVCRHLIQHGYLWQERLLIFDRCHTNYTSQNWVTLLQNVLILHTLYVTAQSVRWTNAQVLTAPCLMLQKWQQLKWAIKSISMP